MNFLVVKSLWGFAKLIFVCSLLLNNNANFLHFDAENCGLVGTMLSSWSILEKTILQFPAFSVSLVKVILSCQTYCFLIDNHGFSQVLLHFLLISFTRLCKNYLNHVEILSVDLLLTFNGATAFKADDKLVLNFSTIAIKEQS